MTALSVFATATNTSATLPATARQLVTAAPSTESSVTVKIGTSTKWGDIAPRGATTTWAGTTSAPALGTGGKVWVLDASTLDGQRLASGSMTAAIKLAVSVGSIAASLKCTIGVLRGSTYTSLGTATLTGQFVNTTANGYSVTVTTAAYDFAPGDHLVVDWDLNITTNSTGSTSATLSVFENGGASESVVTAGYAATPAPTTAPSGVTPYSSKTWSAVKFTLPADADGYVIDRSANGTSGWVTTASVTKVGTFGLSVTAYGADSGVTPGSTWFYRIGAVNGGSAPGPYATYSVTYDTTPSPTAVHDDFTAADNTSLLTRNTPTGGRPYRTDSNSLWPSGDTTRVPRILSNKAVADTSGDAASLLVDTGSFNGVITVVLGDDISSITAEEPLIFGRAADDDSYSWTVEYDALSNVLALSNALDVAGTGVAATYAYTPAAGDSLALVLNGANVGLQVNGTLVTLNRLHTSDTGTTVPDTYSAGTETRHGFGVLTSFATQSIDSFDATTTAGALVTGAVAATATAGMSVAAVVTEVTSVPMTATASAAVGGTVIDVATAGMAVTAGASVSSSVTEFGGALAAGTATMSVGSSVATTASVAMVSVAALTVTARNTALAGVAMSATAGLIPAAVVSRVAQVTMTATAGLAVSAKSVEVAVVAMAATSGLTVQSMVTEGAAVSMAASTAVSVSGAPISPSAVLLVATASLSIAGTVTTIGSTGASATASLVVGAVDTVTVSVSLTASTAAAVAAASTSLASVSMAGDTQVTVGGIVGRPGAATAAAVTSLVVGGQVNVVGTVTMTVLASLSTDGAVLVIGAVTASAIATLVVPSVVSTSSEVLLTGVGQAVAGAALTEVTSVSMLGIASLMPTAQMNEVISVHLVAVTTATAPGIIGPVGEVAMSASASVGLDTVGTIVALVGMSAEGTLEVPGSAQVFVDAVVMSAVAGAGLSQAAVVRLLAVMMFATAAAAVALAASERTVYLSPPLLMVLTGGTSSPTGESRRMVPVPSGPIQRF